MRQLVRDDESHRRLALLHRELQNVGVDHDEAATEEARRKRIHDSAGLDDVDVGRLRQPQRLRMLLDLPVHEWKLPGGDADTVAADAAEEHPVYEEERERSDHAVHE